VKKIIPDKRLIDRRADLVAAQPGSGDDMLTTVELAAWLGVSVQFLEIARSKGGGPPYKKFTTRCVRYLRSDVREWLRDRSFAHTSEYARRSA
jgi:predicted DNA-binding transcriptional regulator AlpA